MGEKCPPLFLFLLLVVGTATTDAQPVEPETDSPFDPQAAWDPTFLDQPPNRYRLGTGTPGPGYWQNRAKYDIRATLDTSKQTIRGTAEITYTNHSPTPLHSIWLYISRLDAPAPKGQATVPKHRTFDIRQVTVQNNGSTYSPTTQSTDARLQVQLKQPVASGGGKKTLTISYSLSLPPPGLPSRSYTKDGVIYEIGHWFPRVAVYDDRRGWSESPIHPASDVHSAYGTFDYRVTVPASMIVAGSGTLMNPDVVLTDNQQRRLMRARDSDRKVAIITPDEAGTSATRPQESGNQTWHFQMNGVRDVAWAASPSFIWNAVQIRRPERRAALAMSFYPRSSMGGEAWNRSTYHVKKTIKYFSRTLFQYPWNTATNVAGAVGKQEFPGLSFCDHDASGYALFSCVVREQGQNWFPVMVSPDEQQHPWMTDGFTTFLGLLAHRHIYKGEFAPKRDDDYIPDGDAPAKTLAPTFRSPYEASIMTPPGVLPSDRHTRLYSEKTALGLMLLREEVLGQRVFDYAFQQFVERWSFREPTPSDFFRSMSDATGRDLSWFWKGWFANAWTLDQAVTGVEYNDGDPANGALISIKLLGKLPMPVDMKVIETDGHTQRVRRPVRIWRRGGTQVVEVDTDARIRRVVLDPDDKLPDGNEKNDEWSPNQLGRRSESR
jgi:hypothetical protein